MSTLVQGSGLLLQLMYGARTAEALSATDAMNQIRLAELFASTIAEHAGIVAASAIYSFGRVSGDTFQPIWSEACARTLLLGAVNNDLKRHSLTVPFLYTALGKPPNHYNIWMSALCQSLTTFLADFVSPACDWKYHSIDYFTHWVTDMRIFLMYILIIITLGSSRCALAKLLRDRHHDVSIVQVHK